MSSLPRVSLLYAGALCLSLTALACSHADSKSSATTAPRTAAAGARTRPPVTVDTTPESPARAQAATAARRNGVRCAQIAGAFNRALGHSATAAGSPPALRRSAEANLRKNQAVLATAPNQIRPDLQTLVDASRQVTDALAKVNYVASALSPDATAALDTPAVKAASARIFAFITQGCANKAAGPSSGGSNRTATTPATSAP
jgi:hypothetical protein